MPLSPENARAIEEYDSWMLDKGRSTRTRHQYVATLTRFADFIGAKPLAEVQGRDVRRWLATLRSRSGGEIQPNTRALKWAVLKGFTRFAQREGMADVDHLASEEAPRRPKKMAPFIPWSQAESVMENCRNLREMVICSLIFGAGLRLGEVTGLRLRYIDLTTRTLHISADTAKGAKARSVPIPRWLAQALRSYIQDERELVQVCGTLRKRKKLLLVDYLLPSPQRADKPLSSRQIQEIFRDCCLRAGVPEELAHCHAGRHTYAVQLLRKGVSLRHIQSALGHSSLSITEMYLNLAPGELSRAITRALD